MVSKEGNMGNRSYEDMLDEYTHLLLTRADSRSLSQIVEESTVLEPFLALTRELAVLFAPVRPRPQFRTALRHSLVVEARRQQTQRLLQLVEPPIAEATDASAMLSDRVMGWLQQGQDWQSEHRWMVGAAVGSAVSLVGIAAYLLHSRGRKAA
jgi:hypothetical protein